MCGRLAVTLARGDDRALHQDVPFAREVLRVGNPGLACQVLEALPDPGQVGGRREAHRVRAAGVLEQDVDEGAALEGRPAEPFIEHIEDRQQLFLRSAAAASYFGL